MFKSVLDGKEKSIEKKTPSLYSEHGTKNGTDESLSECDSDVMDEGLFVATQECDSFERETVLVLIRHLGIILLPKRDELVTIYKFDVLFTS